MSNDESRSRVGRDGNMDRARAEVLAPIGPLFTPNEVGFRKSAPAAFLKDHKSIKLNDVYRWRAKWQQWWWPAVVVEYPYAEGIAQEQVINKSVSKVVHNYGEAGNGDNAREDADVRSGVDIDDEAPVKDGMFCLWALEMVRGEEMVGEGAVEDAGWEVVDDEVEDAGNDAGVGEDEREGGAAHGHRVLHGRLEMTRGGDGAELGGRVAVGASGCWMRDAEDAGVDGGDDASEFFSKQQMKNWLRLGRVIASHQNPS
ncbi:hypothetical protein C8F01DRAFT_1281425 [Mycena amicta]|nr:hypothetical protein C8F01DRAFT_1281425 [Mycena amicta]